MNAIWFVWIAAIVSTFAAFETYAYMHNDVTLSQFVVHVSQIWPPFVFVSGFVCGGLVAHFWWTSGIR